MRTAAYRARPDVQARQRATERAYLESHRVESRLKVQKRKALKRQAPGAGVSAVQWAEVLEYFGHACAYCLRTERKLTMDHVVALSRGGAHDVENVVPACLSCNSAKWIRGILCMLNRR